MCVYSMIIDRIPAGLRSFHQFGGLGNHARVISVGK